MPRPTGRYGFEHRLGEWAASFSRGLTGARCAFFIGLRADGTIRRVYMLAPGVSVEPDQKTKLAGAYSHWFLYSPYEEGKESYLEWLGLEQGSVEHWLQGPLTDSDFECARDEGALDTWPEGWRVIVA